MPGSIGRTIHMDVYKVVVHVKRGPTDSNDECEDITEPVEICCFTSERAAMEYVACMEKLRRAAIRFTRRQDRECAQQESTDSAPEEMGYSEA